MSGLIIDDPMPLVQPALTADELFNPGSHRPTIEGSFEWPSMPKELRFRWKLTSIDRWRNARSEHRHAPCLIPRLIDVVVFAGDSLIRTLDTLATEAGICRRTAQDCLRWLETEGLITWWNQRGWHQGRSVRRSNIYKLIVDAGDAVIAVARSVARPIWRDRHERRVAERRAAEMTVALRNVAAMPITQHGAEASQERVNAAWLGSRQPVAPAVFTTLGTASEANPATASIGKNCPGTGKEGRKEGRKIEAPWGPPVGGIEAGAMREAAVFRAQSEARRQRTAEGLRRKREGG